MSITRELIRRVWAKELSASDLTAAADFVLDAVASAVGGRRTDQGRILLDWGASSGGGVASEAFVMAGLTHILEVDDLHRKSVTHPGCVVIPACWTLAARERPSGRRFLTAVLRGYEVMARIGAAVGPAHYRVWHNTATCGPFGSAAAAASLLGLTEDQTVWALGSAGTQASGLWQFLEEGAMSKHLHAARAAEAGLTSAELARRGFTGPERILEGDRGFFTAMCPDGDADRILPEAEAGWELGQTSIKPWPSCRHTHPTIDAALELHGEANGSIGGGAGPTSIHVETYGAALALCDRPAPETEYEAKFSLQYCAAAALEAGRVGLGSFDPPSRDGFRRAGVPVTVVSSDEFDGAYPDRWGSRVTVELADGRSLVAERSACLGDPEAPIDREALSRKAAELLEFGGMPTTAAMDLIRVVRSLPAAETWPAFDPELTR